MHAGYGVLLASQQPAYQAVFLCADLGGALCQRWRSLLSAVAPLSRLCCCTRRRRKPLLPVLSLPGKPKGRRMSASAQAWAVHEETQKLAAGTAAVAIVDASAMDAGVPSRGAWSEGRARGPPVDVGTFPPTPTVGGRGYKLRLFRGVGADASKSPFKMFRRPQGRCSAAGTLGDAASATLATHAAAQPFASRLSFRVHQAHGAAGSEAGGHGAFARLASAPPKTPTTPLADQYPVTRNPAWVASASVPVLALGAMNPLFSPVSMAVCVTMTVE